MPRPSAAEAAAWDWDLASGRVEWNEALRTLFGYTETVTDAAWREGLIHPDDRERVIISLQRATIARPGEAWSGEYRFRKADGSYALVCERAIVFQDDAGPVRVRGTISPAAVPAARRSRPRPGSARPSSQPAGGGGR
jgi:PAS domain S-box-containing protein